MMKTRCWILLLTAVPLLCQAADEVNRRMAVTFDDLPVVAASRDDPGVRDRITSSLLGALAERDIQAIGFVNEGKFTHDGNADPQQVALLRRWLDAGHDLGNHSFSHSDLHRIPLDDYQRDVLLGETVTRALLAEYDKLLKYYRHPYLHTGNSPGTKRQFESFLAQHDYVVAPVTMDNSEWIFARAYVLAVNGGDAALAQRIGNEYVEYMLKMTDYYENQSRLLQGRNIDHVLLVHANELNADWFGALADRLAERGYAFITLDEALQDPAYDADDTYTGPAGLTWLHRWGISRNVDRALFDGEPETPAHVRELTQVPEHLYQSIE